jgi:enamine deaminase RidA (YjgF/YER057c/UK114 family)
MMRIQVGVLLGLVAMSLGAVANPEFFDEGPMAGKGYPFSESVRVGDILFISGQVGVDENNELVEGGIVGETRQIMSNIGGALERRGLGFSDVSGGRGRVGQVQYHLHELL